MLHIFQLTYIYCINKLVTCESTLEIRHLIFLFKNVTTWRQMLPVFCLIFKYFQISSNPFLGANTNQNEKKKMPHRVQFVMDYQKMPFRSTNFITLHGLIYMYQICTRYGKDIYHKITNISMCFWYKKGFCVAGC